MKILLSICLLASVVSAGDGFDLNEWKTPPPEYSPSFFWMWKAKLELPVLYRQLDEMYAKGIRSVCVHPFPKNFAPGAFSTEMEPDYLTEGYLDILQKVCEYACKLGMNFWLYDEGGWPSGGACGLVAASDREGRFRPTVIRPSTNAAGYEILRKDYAKAGRNYPSIIEKGTTERFISITHDRLYERLHKAFGNHIRFAFTDEPSWHGDYWTATLPWTQDFPEVFLAKKGYDIRPHLRDLVNRHYDYDPELIPVRIDYFEVLSDLFAERFLLPVRDWCHAHHIASSGHLNGEDMPEWSRRYGHGNLLKALRALDAPGVDVIWRQLWPTTIANPGAQLPFPRYATSAAHQIGARKVLSESFAIYGVSLTPAEMKWIVDYQMLRGVNMFVFAYFSMNYDGQWMTLFEPQNGPMNPFWSFEKPYFSYVHRVSSLLASGECTTETAVFYDARSFFVGGPDTDSAVAAHYAIARNLDRLQVDYDFLDDEPILKAKIADGALAVGSQRYRTLVVPPSKWMKRETREKIEAFRQTGGTVIGMEDLVRAKRVCDIRGKFAFDIRATKRVKGKEAVYFIVNEDPSEREISIGFDETGRIVECHADDGTFSEVERDAKGRLNFWLEGYGSRLYWIGTDVAARPVVKTEETPVLNLTNGWTVVRKTEHLAALKGLVVRTCAGERPQPTTLGDWRGQLGWHFSGTCVYRCEFDWTGDGRAELDLGDVKWTCAVRLNGESLDEKFFGPFRWIVSPRRGRNVLEVELANTLGNQLSDDETRLRVIRDFPPASMSYEPKQSLYDKENNASGLCGPVVLRKVK